MSVYRCKGSLNHLYGPEENIRCPVLSLSVLHLEIGVLSEPKAFPGPRQSPISAPTPELRLQAHARSCIAF